MTETVSELKKHVVTKQVLAILEANPRTEATAVKIRDTLLAPTLVKVFAHTLEEDDLLMAVSVLAVTPYGEVLGSEILVLPPYRHKGLGKKLLQDKITWFKGSYTSLFTTKVANDNMASINMCLAAGLKLMRCIESTKRDGTKF